MSFVSIAFLILLSVVLLAYYRVPKLYQNIILLVASYVFYGWWDWRFLGLLLFSSVIDYCCGYVADKKLNPSIAEKYRKYAMWTSIIANVGLLGFFKYYNFFVESFSAIAPKLGFTLPDSTLEIILPVGISFYTFQTMCYVIDIYRGRLSSCRNIIEYMLYVSFFPQLVAGPIERAAHILPQFSKERKFDKSIFYSGMQLAFWGYFKKMVIADNLALIANSIFDMPAPSSSFILIGTYAFAFQIYCDFSGYTDIARGISRMLGIDLMLNFNLPYFAANPSDFWRRWHISLSTWFRDYVYIPLGGNRISFTRTLFNLWLTMLIAGLWHGASWNFVIWGAVHGLLLCGFIVLFPKKNPELAPPKPHQSIKLCLSIILYFHLTCVTWLFFRIDDISKTGVFLKCLFKLDGFNSTALPHLKVLGVTLVPFVLFQLYQYYTELEPWRKWPIHFKVPFYCTLTYILIIYSNPVSEQFIYFQF